MLLNEFCNGHLDDQIKIELWDYKSNKKIHNQTIIMTVNEMNKKRMIKFNEENWLSIE